MRYTRGAARRFGLRGRRILWYMMDRALKERTIGAIVLVAFAILVVPVFLDGPSGDGETISAAVTLPGQNDQPRQQQTIVLERDRTEPVPRPAEIRPEARPVVKTTTSPPSAPAEAKKTPAPSEKIVAAAAAPKETPPARATATAKPASSSTGMWAVQLGSFSNRANAEKLAADLRGDGYAAFLSQLGTSNGELHRVRIGPQKDRDSAETVAAKLGKSGHKGQVVPHP